MDYQKSRKDEFKKYDLEPREMVYATLISCGWNRNDAYMASFGESITVSKEWVIKQVAKLDKKNGVVQFIQDRKDAVKKDRDEEKELMKGLSKEETLKELLMAKRNYEAGSKEWLDINKQIIEVTQMKKDEVKDEESLIHFFLPLSCNLCPLYLKSQKKDGE